MYEQWKATAKYSEEYTKRKEEDVKLSASAEQFFDDKPIAAHKEEEKLSDKYLKQLKMDVKTPTMSNPYTDPKAEKLTSAAYSDMIMDQSLKKMTETAGAPPKLTTATGENMNVILRQGSDVWRRQTYMEPGYRSDLLKSTSRSAQD